MERKNAIASRKTMSSRRKIPPVLRRKHKQRKKQPARPGIHASKIFPPRKVALFVYGSLGLVIFVLLDISFVLFKFESFTSGFWMLASLWMATLLLFIEALLRFQFPRFKNRTAISVPSALTLGAIYIWSVSVVSNVTGIQSLLGSREQCGSILVSPIARMLTPVSSFPHEIYAVWQDICRSSRLSSTFGTHPEILCSDKDLMECDRQVLSAIRAGTQLTGAGHMLLYASSQVTVARAAQRLKDAGVLTAERLAKIHLYEMESGLDSVAAMLEIQSSNSEVNNGNLLVARGVLDDLSRRDNLLQGKLNLLLEKVPTGPKKRKLRAIAATLSQRRAELSRATTEREVTRLPEKN